MATSTILLPLQGATLPDDSDSSNRGPAPRREVSSGAAPANAPKLVQFMWAFDASTDEAIMWGFLLPADYVSGGTLRLKYKMASATSGNVVWKAAIAGCVDSSTDDDAAAFNAVTTASVSAVPGTQGQVKEVTIALGTLTNVAASRKVVVLLGRDANNASDTASGDAYLCAANFEYVS